MFDQLVGRTVMTRDEAQGLIRQLATSATQNCGGMCAFHGTGNSSRIATAALGLSHPAGTFLSEPASAPRIDRIVGDLFKTFNRPEYSVLSMVRANWENTVRVLSATGGSSNLVIPTARMRSLSGNTSSPA